jgi:hypothetical protein
MNKLQKLELVKNCIYKVICKGKFGLKAKKLRIDYYTQNIDKLEGLTSENIQNFNFTIEVANLAFELKKLSLIENKVVLLEIHKYAPELNTLHIKTKATIKVPNATSIAEALEYICKKYSETQIKELVNNYSKSTI